MTVEIFIDKEGCRGCKLCIEACPTDVLEFNEEEKKVQVKEPEDCIACLSCTYICPSNIIHHKNYHIVQNFARNLEFSKMLGKMV